MEKINVKDIQEKFPKAFEEYKQWIEAVTGLKDVDLDFYVEIILISTPRKIFDFFDQQEVFITIANLGTGDSWSWDIGNDAFHASSRNEADQAAIMAAFELLETKL